MCLTFLWYYLKYYYFYVKLKSNKSNYIKRALLCSYIFSHTCSVIAPREITRSSVIFLYKLECRVSKRSSQVSAWSGTKMKRRQKISSGHFLRRGSPIPSTRSNNDCVLWCLFWLGGLENDKRRTKSNSTFFI